MRPLFALRIVLVLLACLIFSTTAEAKGSTKSGAPVHVRAYTRKDGTYVSSHYRSAPRTSARTAAPSGRTTESRTYAPRTLDPAFQPAPPTVNLANQPASPVGPDTEQLASPVGPDTDPKDEAKAQKLLDYAKRQYAMGKIEAGVKWLRWIVKKYQPTKAATEAHSQLEDWKRTEPYKTWRDLTGKFSTEARFIRIDVGSVYLQNKGAKIINVDIKRLCRSDQEYVMDREGL